MGEKITMGGNTGGKFRGDLNVFGNYHRTEGWLVGFLNYYNYYVNVPKNGSSSLRKMAWYCPLCPPTCTTDNTVFEMWLDGM